MSDPKPTKNTKTLVPAPAKQALVKPDSKHHQQLVYRPVEKAQAEPPSKMQANPGLTATQESAPVDRGDFVGSDEEVEVEDESEDSLQYLYGLYYPLGRGGFSTVWPAHDRRDGKDVALKILSSSENAAKEYKIHEAIKQRVQSRSRLVLLQDCLTLTWVDRSKTERKHYVLVLPLHGPSLLTLLHTNNKPLSERMSAAKQILQAVASIHSAGLVHRDIVLGNVLQSQPGYCAPELFHNMEPSCASDVWSYMVLLLYLYTERLVFAVGPGFTGVLNSIVDGVGLLPQEWKGHYEAYDKAKAKVSWYGNGSPAKNMFSAFLDMHRPDINSAEKALVLSIIQQVFRPRPEDRVTAVGLLGNKDFKALMSIYGVH
ncbi:hypothetical protein VP1G_03516 [Cytospora mali]|uniref:Protein kinase domain-containing protein n=1 Tax=Cytospora mali TaxID=578113 RepID=A0A194UWT4_CYTMA|nr:hypothetical protein VP1G_03516 [Valsa mali var. pyri (nom. inval.)]